MAKRKSIKSIAFFSFPPLEHGGGAEQYFIKTSRIVSDKNRSTRVSIITAGDRLFGRFLKLLSLYYLKNVTKIGGYRETTSDVLARLDKVNYIKCDTIKDFKSAILNCDVLYSRNELIDLVLLKCLRFDSLPPVLIAIHTPILYPVANTFHSKLHNILYGSKFYKWLLADATLIKVSNSDDAQLLKTKFKLKNISIVFHPVEKPRAIHHSNGSKLNILFAARLTEQKGIDILIKAIELLGNESFFKNLKFVIAGDGDTDLVDDIKSLSHKHKNVSYLGFVKKQDMHNLFVAADLVVAPSRYETVNQVVLEAGAHGCIVVASDIPGPRDIIVNGVTGYLIDISPSDLSAHIKRLYITKVQTPQEFKKIGNNASKYVIAKFSAKAYDEAMWELFLEAERLKYEKA